MAGKRKAGRPPKKRAKTAKADYDDTSSDDAAFEDHILSPRSLATRSRDASESQDGTRQTGRVLRQRGPSKLIGNGYGKSFDDSVKDEDLDELQQDIDDFDDDGDFRMVTSDIQPQNRGRPRKGANGMLRPKSTRAKAPVSYAIVGGDIGGDSDIEFEGTRRSNRSNKVTKSLRDPTAADDEDDDDDIFYEGKEEITPPAPRVVNIREIFQPCPSDEFKAFHQSVCSSCHGNEAKGALIYCQGCSYAYHRTCLGARSERTQRVTKVGPENFVMQCQFCVGKTKKGRGTRAPERPDQAKCTTCHVKGSACAAFSEKKSPKTEEKLRLENGGEDPIQDVAPNLLNNPSNVLFRCARCRRAWHFAHLPHPTKNRDPAIKDPKNIAKHRLEEYSIHWNCGQCLDVENLKIDKMVAWHPADKSMHGKRNLQLESFNEDEIEYLIKWANKSYNHCVWVPGAWMYEYASAPMRIAFFKKNFELEDLAHEDDENRTSLLKFTTEQAVPDEYLIPEVILDVIWAPRSKEQEIAYKKLSPQGKKEADLSRIHHVLQIYVKFEGLTYQDVVWDTPPSPSSDYWSAFEAAYEEFLNGKHFVADSSKRMAEDIELFRKFDVHEVEFNPKVQQFKMGKLMDYQVKGVSWMLVNYYNQKSIVLADEMGLGKTIQVVAFLRSLILDKPRIWPFLVVVPNATCQNWRREIRKWAPELRVVLYYNGKEPQELSYKYELFPDNSGPNQMRAHIVIMSYQSAIDPTTRARFRSVKWQGLVVDEAHSLKNDQNNLPRALKAMNIPFSLLLTGTPLQNNKKELFTLLQFVKRDIDAAALDEKYRDENLTKESVQELQDIIRPYFFRRTKAEVLKFLPPMAQVIVPLSMTVLQEKLCKSILEKNPQLIRAIFANHKMKSSERTGMNNILLQLRKCLCHPFIYSRAIEDQTVAAEVAFRNLIEASGKLLLLEIMLPKLKERGHRVLIFSQFLGQLDIMEDFLIGIGVKYSRIDGDIKSLDKQKRIDQFNAPDSPLFAMLLSTRAGGVGINLATADTVIILDPDWNPHQDIQALSRAHRIGQTKKVLCFQFMTQDSAEERIMEIGRKKMALDHVLIETMDHTNKEENSQDIESALRHGAAALFGEGQKRERITYDSAAVDKLLDRANEEEVEVSGEKAPESLFTYARVWANEDGALKENVAGEEKSISLSVWDDIIRQREEQARQEEERNRQILGRGGRRRQATNYVVEDGEAMDIDNENGDKSPDEDFVGGESDPDSSDNENMDEADEMMNAQRGKNAQDGSAPPTTIPIIGSTGSKARSSHALPGAPRASGSRPVANSLVPAGLSPRPAGHAGLQPPARAGGVAPRVRGEQGVDGTRAPRGAASGVAVILQPAAAARASQPASRNALSPNQRPQQQFSRGHFAAPNPTGLSEQTIALLKDKIPALRDLQSTAPLPSYHNNSTVPQRPNVNGTPPAAWNSNVRVNIPTPTVPSQRIPQSQIPQIPRPPHQNPPPSIPPQNTPQRAPRQTPCFVCGYLHPPIWECPEMSDKVKLRLALDDLKTSQMTPAERQSRRTFLLSRLSLLNEGRAI